MMSKVQASNIAKLRRMITAADLLAQSIPYVTRPTLPRRTRTRCQICLASKAQTYADALRSAAFDLIDPEMAEDDDTLFKLHLSAVAAADRLDNTIRNA